MTNTFGDRATQQIAQTVREVARRIRNSYYYRPNLHQKSFDSRRAVTAEDVTPPSSPLAARASFDIYFINMLDDGTSELDASGPVLAYTDDPDFTAERGTLLRVEWLCGGWMPYYAACSPDPALITALDAL